MFIVNKIFQCIKALAERDIFILIVYKINYHKLLQDGFTPIIFRLYEALYLHK